MENTPGCNQQVGTKACKSNRSMALIDSLWNEFEGTNLPTQLYRDPPPSLLTIVGSAVATIVLNGYLLSKWLDMREGERQTWSSAAKKTHAMNPVNT
jgi:hypothetical protein